MCSLLRASYYRYFTSPLTWCAATAVLLLGIVNGYLATAPMYASRSMDIEPSFFLYPIVVSAIVTSLITGREFSDRTIRNKLTCGASKTQIYLSECITGCTFSTLCFLLTALPVILFNLTGMQLLPKGTPVLLFCILFLISVAGMVVTVTCCMLAANRTYGVLIAGGALILLLFAGFLIEGGLALCRDEYFIRYNTEITYDEDGNRTQTEVEYKEYNKYYLPEETQKKLRYASALSSGYAYIEVINYFQHCDDARIREEQLSMNYDPKSQARMEEYWQKREQELQKQTDMLPVMLLGQCLSILLCAGIGVFFFRKRNLV